MFKKFIFTTLTAGLFLAFAASASADVTCTPIYGGGQTCVQTGQISINKTVQNPQSNAFVDNLTVNDPKYTPGQNVSFQLSVTNGSGSATNITVKDTFPQFVSFVSGPGNFDANTNTLTFDAGNFDVNQTKSYTIVGKVADTNSFSGTSCLVNQSVVNGSNGQNAQDNALFCVQIAAPTQVPTKGGIPVVTPAPIKVTPPTGPEMLPLLALIPAGLSGLILRKRSNKSFNNL